MIEVPTLHGFSFEPLHLTLHPWLIILHKGDHVERVMNAWSISIDCDGSRSDGLGLCEAICPEVGIGEGRIGKCVVRVQTQGSLSSLDRLLGLSNACILVGEVVEGNPIVWVAVSPQLVGFDSFVVFIGNVYVVVGCDIELLSFADMLAPLN